jgi:hypothetical protein
MAGPTSIAAPSGQPKALVEHSTSLEVMAVVSSFAHARATGLAGRRSEREELERILDAVGAGASRVLVFRGEPGSERRRCSTT